MELKTHAYGYKFVGYLADKIVIIAGDNGPKDTTLTRFVLRVQTVILFYINRWCAKLESQ